LHDDAAQDVLHVRLRPARPSPAERVDLPAIVLPCVDDRGANVRIRRSHHGLLVSPCVTHVVPPRHHGPCDSTTPRQSFELCSGRVAVEIGAYGLTRTEGTVNEAGDGLCPSHKRDVPSQSGYMKNGNACARSAVSVHGTNWTRDGGSSRSRPAR